jgi:hypothetical protein
VLIPQAQRFQRLNYGQKDALSVLGGSAMLILAGLLVIVLFGWTSRLVGRNLYTLGFFAAALTAGCGWLTEHNPLSEGLFFVFLFLFMMSMVTERHQLS